MDAASAVPGKQDKFSEEEMVEVNLHLCLRLVELRFNDSDPKLAERMRSRTTTVGDLDKVRQEFIALYRDPRYVSHHEGLKEAYDWVANEISMKTADPGEVRRLLQTMWDSETKPPDSP